MSDEDDVTTPDEPTDKPAAEKTPAKKTPAKTPADKPAPSTPASRARRIGGRPLPGPGKAADTDSTSTDADEAATKPVAKKKAAAPPATPSKSAAKVKAAAKGKPAGKDTGTEDDAEPKPAKKPRDAEKTLARLRWLPAVVLAAAVVVFAVLCVTLGHGVWWAKKSVSAQRDQVLAAAKTCVGSITNYDYRKLPASEQAGLACTTGTFQAQYKQAMDTVVAKLAPQTKTVQTFQVAEAGVESVSADGKQWVVLVYGQQAVTNADTGPTSPRQDILSAQVTLNKVDGQWRVSALKRL